MEKYTLERGSAKYYDTCYSCKLCDFNEYIDSSECADSIVPRNSGGSEKSNDSVSFVNCVILVISRNMVILVNLLIQVNHVILVNLVITRFLLWVEVCMIRVF